MLDFVFNSIRQFSEFGSLIFILCGLGLFVFIWSFVMRWFYV